MTQVLVDTSGLVLDHFRRRNEHLIGLLSTHRVLGHPVVLLELACGTPPAPRARSLADLAELCPATPASMGEVRDFIERESLFGLHLDHTQRRPVDAGPTPGGACCAIWRFASTRFALN